MNIFLLSDTGKRVAVDGPVVLGRGDLLGIQEKTLSKRQAEIR